MQKKMTLMRSLAAFALAGSLGCANAEVISFDGIGDDGEAFTFYTEDGFMVFPAGDRGSTTPSKPAFRHLQSADPGCGPECFTPRTPLISLSLQWTSTQRHAGSISIIGYEGMPMFGFSTTIPNPFGQFVTTFNAASDVLIDLL
jgi:hypothetical protein